MAALFDLVDLLARRAHARPAPFVVGLTGSVASGKTRLADDLAEALSSAHGLGVAIVSTDGFLYPNAVLDPQGMTYHKGFPGTYDTEALMEFLRALRRCEPLVIPIHSHETYDIVADGATVAATDVVIVEGLNLLGTHATLGDITVGSLLDDCIYLDADRADLQRWFVERFMAFRAAAFDDPTSFYRTFADMDEDAALASAAFVWNEINAANLDAHIEPFRDDATILVRKGADHSIAELVVSH